MRVLCIDIEGGHGGSSKSLFSAIEGMDRSDFEIEVVVVGLLRCECHETFLALSKAVLHLVFGFARGETDARCL